MNPWQTIWLHPRKTVRYIVDTNPTHWVLVLAMVVGGLEWLLQAWPFAFQVTERPLLALMACAAVGVVLGWLGLYIYGWIYKWVGGWFGGSATAVQIRAAIAWSKIPILSVCVVIGVIGAIVSFSVGLTGASVVMALSGMLLFGVGIWSLVLLCHTLGEVHQFSAWKGLGTIMIPQVLLVVPVAFIGLMAAIIIPNVVRGRADAHQAVAVATLHSASVAMESYRAMEGVYAPLDELAAQDLLSMTQSTDGRGFDASFTDGTYTYRLGGMPSSGMFCLEASPADASALQTYSIDETGAVYAYDSGPGCDDVEVAWGGTPQ